VGFVLLIACANISSLQLARMLTGQREVAIREALGATRLRLVRQFLAESLLLALAGGALGLAFAAWGIRMLRAIAPPGTPRVDHLTLDPAVLGVTAAISIAAGVLFGLAPALQASARPVGVNRREGWGSPSGVFFTRRPHRLRSAFVILEVALAVILVVGATLLARSFQNLVSLRLGFRTDRVLTMSVNFAQTSCIPWEGSNVPQCQLLTENVVDRIQAQPGVEKAAATSYVPLDGANGVLSLRIEGQAEDAGIEHGSVMFFRPVTPGYFQAMDMPLLAGRGFSRQDVQGSQKVAIVNEAFARRYFSGSALGHRIGKIERKGANLEWMEIVGEVPDSWDGGLDTQVAAEYYVPYAQAGFFPGATLVVRTAAEPLVIAAVVQRAIWSVDKDAPITDLKTMDQIVAEKVAGPRFQTLLLGAFGALGLLLAVVGIYGVISYAITQRKREIGIRMALGAQPGAVLRNVMGHGVLLALSGIAAGLTGALALTRFLASLLFEVKPTDPTTFAAVAVVLLAVATLATYVPARRAMRVDPMGALRHE
jgi:putative ABC transport system permease protein